MALAIFDLDNTLLAGDSDHAWGNFLLDQGWVDADEYQRANDHFYAQYRDGSLDIHEYVRFVTAAIERVPGDQRLPLRETFLEDIIRPMVAAGTMGLLERHRREGDTLLIITATLDFITEPIARQLGVDALIATNAERDSDRDYPSFTGAIAGTPAFQGGKVERLRLWLEDRPDLSDAATWFYSDSHNDLPLLKAVDNPVAVDPDDRLKSAAEQNAWPIISLRD